jgi:hypothetical protein
LRELVLVGELVALTQGSSPDHVFDLINNHVRDTLFFVGKAGHCLLLLPSEAGALFP